MNLSISEKDLQKAKKSLKKMKEIKSKDDEKLLMEFESNWIDFLNYLEKISKKSELECKHFSNFQPWQGKYINERRKDPLLRYLKNARDADQHSIQPITSEKGHGIQLISPTEGATFTEGDSITLRAKITIPRIETETFKNFNVIYSPPAEHMGEKLLDSNDPIEIAELGIRYYEEYLNNIRAKFHHV